MRGAVSRKLSGNLYRDGASICMMTHDPRYARHAARTVLLFDGRVVDFPRTARSRVCSP